MDINQIFQLFVGELIRGLKIGALPGALAGGIALPLMFGEGLVFKVATGMVLGGIGMTLFQGVRIGNQISEAMRSFRSTPSVAGELIGMLIFSLIQGALIGALVILAFFDTVRTIVGILIGTLLGIIIGMIFNVFIANLSFDIDSRTYGLIIGAMVAVLITAFTSKQDT